MVTNKRGVYAITLDWRILYWEHGNYGFSARVISHMQIQTTCGTTFGFFEPAIKLWCKRDNFYQFCIFPVRSQCGDADHGLSLEQALQQTLRPIYNWPWINPLLKRWRLGKTRFGLTSVKPTVAFGRRLVRRYKKRTRAQHCSLVEQQFDNHLRILQLLYMLGSDTLMKFECSKLLRSTQADHDYIFLLIQIESNFDGTLSVKSSAATQALLFCPFVIHSLSLSMA